VPSGEAAIVCDAVSYQYDAGKPANDTIDLTINRGEFVAIIGPNGAGKTTLVRLIASLLRPSAGRISVLGADTVITPSAAKQHLSLMPQQAGLFESLTVEQHLMCFGPLRNLDRIQTRSSMERVMDQCDLGDLRSRRTRSLSGGERRRLLVALTMLADSEVLILDEPTGGLDPTARRNLWDNLKQQQNNGKTILLTSHHMEEVEHLADRIAFIANGRITQVGTIEELRKRLGKSYRLTRFADNSGHAGSDSYFDSLADAQRFAAENQLESYAVEPVGMEELYFRLSETAASEVTDCRE
jgi:ABC-2 type transport system ATP-binding protein